MSEDMQTSLRVAMSSDEHLRERVKLIVIPGLSRRQVDSTVLREAAKLAMQGVGAGLKARGQAAGAALSEAVYGLDEAFSRAVYAMQMVAEEAWDGGRQFATNDLRKTVNERRGLEGNFLQSLRMTADTSQGWIKQELVTLGEHLVRIGTKTGRRVAEVSGILGHRLHRAIAGSRGDANALRGRLTAITSGLLGGLAAALEAKH